MEDKSRALTLWEGDPLVQIESFKSSMMRTSREASLGVWIKGGKVYKLSKVEHGQDKAVKKLTALKDLTKEAIKKEVPSPAMDLTGVDHRLKWYDDKGQPQRAMAQVTNELSAKNGMFFHLGKDNNGHESSLAKLVNSCTISVRKSVKNAVHKALEFKLSDPQGFFSPDDVGGGVNGPIAFIDIHQHVIESSKLRTLHDNIKTD